MNFHTKNSDGTPHDYPCSREWWDSMVWAAGVIGAVMVLAFVLAVAAGYGMKYWPALVNWLNPPF